MRVILSINVEFPEALEKDEQREKGMKKINK